MDPEEGQRLGVQGVVGQGAAEQLEQAGKRLHVVVPDGPVRRLLEITGTAQRFSLHSTRERALAAG